MESEPTPTLMDDAPTPARDDPSATGDARLGGIALIAGSAGTLLTMTLHPSGRDLFAPGGLEHATHAFVGAHALALVSMPLVFLGALALSRRLAAPDRLAVAALVAYGIALAAGLVAAVVAGFVAPDLARGAIAAAPSAREAWQVVFHYNGRLNQAFAAVLVVAASLAILLWSAAILRTRALARGVGVYGLILAPATVAALLSGHLRLDVHGFGLVVLAQAAWFVVVGALLCRRRAA